MSNWPEGWPDPNAEPVWASGDGDRPALPPTLDCDQCLAIFGDGLVSRGEAGIQHQGHEPVRSRDREAWERWSAQHPWGPRDPKSARRF